MAIVRAVRGACRSDTQPLLYRVPSTRSLAQTSDDTRTDVPGRVITAAPKLNRDERSIATLQLVERRERGAGSADSDAGSADSAGSAGSASTTPSTPAVCHLAHGLPRFRYGRLRSSPRHGLRAWSL